MKTDGSVIIDTRIIDGGMEKGFEAIKNEMSSVGVAAEKLGDKLKLAFSSGASAPIQEAFAKIKTLEAQLTSVAAEFKDAVSADDDKGAEKLAAKRTAIYDKLEAARRKLAFVVLKEAEKEATAEKKAAQKTLREKEKAYNAAIKPAQRFGKRLTSIMASALVFNVVSKGLREVTQYFGSALKSNEEFSESWSKLKGAAVTAVQPIYEALLPALTAAVNVATKLLLTISKAFAAMGGRSAEQVKESAKATYDQAKATQKLGKAAKNAKKAFAGFDEISVLGGNGSSASSADSESGGASFAFQDIDVDSKLSEIAALTAAAVFALGIILTLSGANIPLGLGMIVFGGLLLYDSIAENWGGIESDVFSTADKIAYAGGALLLAIGIILTFCCPSHMGLGIGLIIGGASLLGTVIALNWNAVEEALQDPVKGIVAFIMGTALLIVGILACFAGAWGIGIGCIIGGAALMVAVVAVNWNAITDALQGPIGEVTAIVSGALLVLGIILLFTGVGTGLGLGLLIAGAAGLATVVAFNWNAIVEWVKKAWQGVKNFWNTHIAKVFTGQFWLDLAKKCGNGLIGGFEGAINGIISMFETMINWIVGGLNKISIKVPDWVPVIGGKNFGFDIPEAHFKRVSIPRLARGAVIPPNREFLAVLGDQKHGTNVEAPLDTIKQALAEVLELEGGSERETIVSVNFTGDLAQLARVLKPAIETETRRKGQSLAIGGVF